jgi:copper resistance protein D
MISFDPATLAAVLIKAAGYAASLVAAGAPLFLLAHPAPETQARATRRLAVFAVVAAAACIAAAVAARASFLGGGGVAAATDPMLSGIVLDNPVGDSLAVRAVGLALVAALVFGADASVLAAIGGALIAASYAAVGHALEGPRALLAALLTAHLLGVAYWIAALIPLRRLARGAPEAGPIAEAFGRNAAWVVGGLALAGAALFAVMTGDPLAALATGWGAALAVKLGFVAGLLGLAARNKLRLAPALLAGRPGAGATLRRAIDVEIVLVAFVLLATAALTTAVGGPRG